MARVALYYRWPKHDPKELGCINYRVLDLRTGAVEEVSCEDTEGSVDQILRVRHGLGLTRDLVFVNCLLRRVPPKKYGNGCHLLTR